VEALLPTYRSKNEYKQGKFKSDLVCFAAYRSGVIVGAGYDCTQLLFAASLGRDR
jgi:hypothetical protein